jgi:GntR family transcriptional repressor for pyruvate dehydrogenase complex
LARPIYHAELSSRFLEQEVAEFEPVQPYRIANEIVRKISTMIWDGELDPGSRFPPERDLAERFKVSRPTLREAIHVLEALGLLEVRGGGGTYVSRKPIALSSRLLEHMLQRDNGLMAELIETRYEFEGRNSELAAKNATPQDLQRLDKCVQLITASVEAGRDDFRHDIDFHLAVAESTHNRVRLFITTSMLLAHFEILRESRRRGVQRNRALVGDLLKEHRAIYSAIKARRPEKAREAMRLHLEAAYERNQLPGGPSPL